ncbi:hypothetical protein [Dolichospermum planctonicum]|nr:hypothetical protein [Dolichospermum planctonicum]
MNKFPQTSFPRVTCNEQTAIPSIPKIKGVGTTFLEMLKLAL